jgi:DNA invertase Pin-like site-specific DNA recombinase
LSILAAALQQFSTLRIDFISYTQNIDTTTPMGRLFYNVIGSFAEFEREMIVERVRSGLANARRRENHSADRRIGAPSYASSPSVTRVSVFATSPHREDRSASGMLQILRRATRLEDPSK